MVFGGRETRMGQSCLKMDRSVLVTRVQSGKPYAPLCEALRIEAEEEEEGNPHVELPSRVDNKAARPPTPPPRQEPDYVKKGRD